jgi:hypothetical protein
MDYQNFTLPYYVTGHNRKVQESIYAANEIRSTLYVCLNGSQCLHYRPQDYFLSVPPSDL